MSAKVIFANRYFFPDLSATSQMLSDLTRRLAQAGVEVHVVCSRQLYEDSGARLCPHESVENVHVHRVWTATFGRQRMLGRACDYLSFYLTAGIRLLRLARDGDVLVMKTDPPLLSILGALVAATRGATLVNWLQDVFPEVAVRLYPGRIPAWAARGLQRARDWSLTAARTNIVLGTRMNDYLLSRGIEQTRVRAIENWADGEGIRPKPVDQSRLRQRLGFQQRFVIAYSGNLGRAHEFDTLLQAAELLREESQFAFLFIGGGARFTALKAQVAKRGLESFRFLSYQPREALEDSLAAADVHLVCLLPELEGLIVPSKIYGILAAGRPTVFIGDVDGEVARVLREGECGMSVPRGDGPGLAGELRALYGDLPRTQSMGLRARSVFESRHTLKVAAEQWGKLLAPCLDRKPENVTMA